MQTDSLLAQKSIFEFPPSYSFSSMQPTTDGNYILTGTTTKNAYSNELIKLSANGILQWSKTISASDNFTDAQQTQDNGFVLTGNRSWRGPFGNTIYNTVIVKTDASGNKLWEKVFDETILMENATNLVPESDGLVVAGIKRKQGSAYCNYCDSLAVSKLDNQGNLRWQTVIPWGLNSYSLADTRIAKAANGNYYIINKGAKGIFLFSPQGTFLDRKLTQNAYTTFNTRSSDGNILLLQTEWGSGYHMKISKLDAAGITKWNTSINGNQLLPNGGIRCCSNSTPVSAIALKNGGNLILGYRRDAIADTYNEHNVIVLLPLDEQGRPL